MAVCRHNLSICVPNHQAGDLQKAFFMPIMNFIHQSVAHPLLTQFRSTEPNIKDAKANTKNDKGMAAYLSSRSLRRIWRIKRPRSN